MLNPWYTAEKSWKQLLFKSVDILPSWATFQISFVCQSFLQFLYMNYLKKFKKRFYWAVGTCGKYLYVVSIWTFWGPGYSSLYSDPSNCNMTEN